MAIRSGDEAGNILEAKEVFAGYSGKVILRGLDLVVRSGEIYALLGANGTGKTTTLNLFLGFVTPKSGQIRVAGFDPATHLSKARSHLAYIPENVALYEHLTARENITYLLDLAGQSEKTDVINQALVAAGLDTSDFNRRVADFSKGMRQKVAIALVLMRKVPAVLLDEPTSGLDPQACADFNQLLRLLRERGVAVLMVTHDLLCAVDIADRIGFLDDGCLIEEFMASGDERFDVSTLHRRYAAKVAV
jgi:ABC-2 type transport system ATP-binding protein